MTVMELEMEMILDGLAVVIDFWVVGLWAVLGDYFADY